MLLPNEETNLREEYKVLNKAIWERGHAVWLVNSVLIPSSILVLLEANIYRSSIGNISVALFSLLSFALATYCLLFLYLSNKVNDLCWKRINKIEEILGIKGNKLIYSQIEGTCWYCIRRKMWYVLLSVLAVSTLILSIWNFLLWFKGL